jgi:hypothetical protein
VRRTPVVVAGGRHPGQRFHSRRRRLGVLHRPAGAQRVPVVRVGPRKVTAQQRRVAGGDEHVAQPPLVAVRSADRLALGEQLVGAGRVAAH